MAAIPYAGHISSVEERETYLDAMRYFLNPATA
jgi:hypothetical protein